MSDSIIIVEKPPDIQLLTAQGAPDIQLLTLGQQGPAGPPGPSAQVTQRVAPSPIGGQRILVGIAGSIAYASNANLTHMGKVLGISVNAASTGQLVDIHESGEITDSSWTWAIDQPMYLGINGLMTQVPPAAGSALFLQVLGFSVSTTKVFFRPFQPIVF